MKKARYSESQIIKVLKKVEGGRTAKSVCREYGIAEADHRPAGEEDPAEEVRRLRRENAQLRMERDILKKATAFFAKESS